MSEGACVLEHSVEADVSATFYMEQVRAAFESNLPAGMKRIASAMVKAEATSSGRSLR
jgi:hypothetical protein